MENDWVISEDGTPVRRASKRKKVLFMLVAGLLIAVLVSVTTVVLLELKNNETTPKNESTKKNKESTYQTNATIEPAVSISLLFTKQRTPLGRTTTASQSQILSTLWASTPKLYLVSSISIEVTKSSPTASHVPFTTLQQESKLSTMTLYTPTNEIIYSSGPITLYSSRAGSSNKASSTLVNIEKPTTSNKDDGIKTDAYGSSLSVTMDMIENITSALPATPSTISNTDEITKRITATSQPLNQGLETTLSRMPLAISESNSEINSMLNKLNPYSQQVATLTQDSFTATHPFVMSPTSEKEISTTRLPVSTLRNKTKATKLAVTSPTLSITDDIRKENTATLLPVTPDNNKVITTAAPIGLSATLSTYGKEKAVTKTLLAKTTVSNKTIMLPVTSKISITASLPIITSTNESISTYIPVTFQSNSNKEKIRKEINASSGSVKTNTDDAIKKVSAKQTISFTTAEIKNTTFTLSLSETLGRSKTHTAVLPVTPSTILDKIVITNVIRTTSLSLTTVGNNTTLPVTLAMPSITDSVTNEFTATSSPVLASMDNANSAKVSITASASSTSDRITDKIMSTLLPSTFPTSYRKINSTEFITSQPKSSSDGITNEINSASQPDKAKNLLSTYWVTTAFPSAISPTISDTNKLNVSLTPFNITLSQYKGDGTATTATPCIYFIMLCYILICSFNDMTAL